jgi:hypothetical protein
MIGRCAGHLDNLINRYPSATELAAKCGHEYWDTNADDETYSAVRKVLDPGWTQFAVRLAPPLMMTMDTCVPSQMAAAHCGPFLLTGRSPLVPEVPHLRATLHHSYQRESGQGPSRHPGVLDE